eukprot:scaffold1061_cov182-Ochromonas_danica.AAC.1
MSVVLQLPKDILHNIYSEWLEWKDLTSLDSACVEKNEREEWLTSLTSLKKSCMYEIWNSKLILFYEWLSSRNVFCVEGFPIKVDYLEDLVTVFDMESYCPLLRSIEIERWIINGIISDISLTQVERNLSLFLSHCHNLQGMTVYMSDHFADGSIVLAGLIEQLRENSLVTISLQDFKECHDSYIKRLLTKHASSLRELYVSNYDEVDMNYFVSILMVNKICLRVLSIQLRGESSQEMSFLIYYISSSGGLLETLEVDSCTRSFNTEDLVSSVAASCPKLARLVTYECEPCSVETLRRLYEQCPHLEDVFIGDLRISVKQKSVSIDVIGNNEEWSIRLSATLRRRQYKKVTLCLKEGYNHRVENLKSMLEPYLIHLDASTTLETSLISLLQDLPHVNSFYLFSTVSNQYTDATLAAISEHANSLTELDLSSIDFSDKQLSELIKTCQLLESLTVDDCGLERVEAISMLSNLKMVKLSVSACVSRELLEGLLLDENVTWPSSLKEGTIKVFGCVISFEFNNKSHQWIVQQLQ